MKEVVIVSGVRLPVGSYGGSLKDVSAIDMGAMVVKEAVNRAGIDPTVVDEVIIGQVGEVAENGFVARAVSLRAGMPKETTAYSVNRQCGSGLQSIVEAVMEIQTGQADVVVAGGTENISRDFKEPVYTNISKDYRINMVWHNVSNATANGYIQQSLAGTEGLNTIAPTWFSISDTEGNLTSIASADYVSYAHQSGLEVWAVLRDFHGGINSYDETYQVLSYTSKRQRLISQVIQAALASDVDGINLDFELVSSECGPHYIQFVRELSVACRENGLVFSVDNYVPQPYNQHYDIAEQGVVADYVIIMAYDEHTDASYEAGSVASISYLQNGIADALDSVPRERLIAGVPFFTRLWLETPKTEDELAGEAGTEAASYPDKISSKAMGMDEAAQTVADAGAQTVWDEETKQNYAEWKTDGGTYKIWLEDADSLEEKLKVINENELAGIAEWSLGMENQAVWNLIRSYLN